MIRRSRGDFDAASFRPFLSVKLDFKTVSLRLQTLQIFFKLKVVEL